MTIEPQTADEVRASAVQVYRKHQAAFMVRRSYPQTAPVLLTHVEPEPDPPRYQQAIATLTEIDPTSLEPSLRDILRAVSAVTGISMLDLISPRRERRYARARFIYYHLARVMTSKGTPSIGKHCGGRDHSTVLHGLRQVKLHPAEYAEKIAAVTTLFITRGSVYGAMETHKHLSL